MDEKEKSVGKKVEWMEQIATDFMKAISRKYTLLEIFLLWMVITIIDGVLGAFVFQIVSMLLVVMNFRP